MKGSHKKPSLLKNLDSDENEESPTITDNMLKADAVDENDEVEEGDLPLADKRKSDEAPGTGVSSLNSSAKKS